MIHTIEVLFDSVVYSNQFQFQAAYALDPLLNAGCNTDGAKLGQRPYAVNLDLFDVDEHTGATLPVDVIGDARQLPWKTPRFRSVVLGEILEHMTSKDAIQCLKEAKRVLLHGLSTVNSRVVVTIPHDDRREKPNHKEPEGKMYTADGIYAYHYRLITREELVEWVLEAGLTPTIVADIAYPFDGIKGTGLIAEVTC